MLRCILRYVRHVPPFTVSPLSSSPYHLPSPSPLLSSPLIISPYPALIISPYPTLIISPYHLPLSSPLIISPYPALIISPYPALIISPYHLPLLRPYHLPLSPPLIISPYPLPLSSPLILSPCHLPLSSPLIFTRTSPMRQGAEPNSARDSARAKGVPNRPPVPRAPRVPYSRFPERRCGGQFCPPVRM